MHTHRRHFEADHLGGIEIDITVTVWPTRENLQSYSALWNFEQGQRVTPPICPSVSLPTETPATDDVRRHPLGIVIRFRPAWQTSLDRLAIGGPDDAPLVKAASLGRYWSTTLSRRATFCKRRSLVRRSR
jgi:hypothetical protein